MADSRASRPIEDFFVNPAFNFDFNFNCDTRHQQSKMVDNNNLYTGATNQYNDCWFTSTKALNSDGKAPTAVTHLVNNSSQLRGYTSDEETASPIDDDNSSVYSDYSGISDFTLPEALAESCNQVEQQCSEAQAVKIQSAGKAKVVSLPKLVDIPSRRGVVRPASISLNPNSSSRRNSAMQQSVRSSEDSHHGSVNSSVMDSPASTAPSSLIIDRSLEVKRRSSVASRHVPLLEAARAISPTTPYPTSTPSTPLEPRSVGLIKRENTVSSQRSNSTTSSLKLPIKRMNKLSSNFSLNRIGKEFRDTFVPKDAARRSYLEDVKEPEPVMVTQQAPQSPRNSSISKPKMVARAANERAPTIELPPFPGDQDDFSSDWPLKLGATSSFPKMRSVSNRVASDA
ncbi:hypothetical protein CLAFUW4_07116 [Fulvia fulva]|uniref:Uncharacterized protein n=1 Tax=Passalora fulva TaxID=5499 RepID=A0A9Q8P9Z4_PASFU|nr:uncharacterized protein CLAFUR5_07250 [Fulvia fulva]KAK4621752.1 hypothetical protein CLAFUR4_07125 [Fulvia fulva]KAK4623408.1 hypothetical protein CLAFUR0_07123 [Fulvia fulva]UJO18618.1 hypothetical protein CLAFUR5_07250 [Fulvia fulva]WPV16428.1 hypothetical protein CLAFUW4_07116 [Fulvia fulva]WPV31225.1 hypothetical protein CLAFUW7_07117 [Fulvia fulva]